MGATVKPRRNPDGTLYRTDNGNLYLEPTFPPLTNAPTLDQQLHAIPGIIETGLFIALRHRNPHRPRRRPHRT